MHSRAFVSIVKPPSKIITFGYNALDIVRGFINAGVSHTQRLEDTSVYSSLIRLAGDFLYDISKDYETCIGVYRRGEGS